MLSDNFDLNTENFVQNRDSLYVHYFPKQIYDHTEMLGRATDCFQDIANYHHRIGYNFESQEANDQVWYMAEWILHNRAWGIINGMDLPLLANELGTAIFSHRYIGVPYIRPDGWLNDLWTQIREFLRKNKITIIILIIRGLMSAIGISIADIPQDIIEAIRRNGGDI